MTNNQPVKTVDPKQKDKSQHDIDSDSPAHKDMGRHEQGDVRAQKDRMNPSDTDADRARKDDGQGRPGSSKPGTL